MSLMRFDSDALPPSQRLAGFYEAMGKGLCRLTPLPSADPFAARVEARRLGGRTIGRIAATSHDARRNARDVAADGREEIHVVLMLRGARHLSTLGQERPVSRGQLVLLPAWRPFALRGAGVPYAAFSLALPTGPHLRHGLERLLRRPEPLARRPFARIAAAACLALAQRLTEGSLAEIDCLAATVERLVQAMAADRDERRGETRDAMLARRVRHEIDFFAGDPDLDLGALSARLGAPAWRIQRALATDGTSFSTLLREARLERAWRALAAGEHPGQKVAWDCGYAELSAFHRAFRRAFGCTPGACKASAGAACRPPGA